MKTLLTSLLLAWTPLASAGDDASRKEQVHKLYADLKPKFAAAPELSASSLKEHRDTYVIVDVREPREREVSVIPGAITLDQLATDERRPVAVYCTVGYRSGLEVVKLRQRGVEAFNVVGGVLSWTHEHGELVGPTGESTRKVHVYGRTWNAAHSDYEAVW